MSFPLPLPHNLKQGKKLSDESLYVINIIDLEPAGLLVKAYNQETNAEYYLSPSEGQLKDAGLTRSEEDLTKVRMDGVCVCVGGGGDGWKLWKMYAGRVWKQ